VSIPEGDFFMGSSATDPYAEPDETPMHRVHLTAYWIDQVDVSNARFALCVAAGACQPPPTQFSAASSHAYYGDPTYADSPVVNVTWQQAADYCTWASRRLPSEAEWEKAARSIDARRFPWGGVGVPAKDLLNFCDRGCPFASRDQSVDDGYAETSPVGAYPRGASPYGVLDVAGNVWQWVADWYGDRYYATSPARDPLGPASGTLRVARGSSWLDDAYGGFLIHARAANRFALSPETARSNVGFRCAVTGR
jgi:formylglycine-generating enzyme required for sulfatase activity